MKQVNIIIGRFQPFTKGHKHIAETLFNENGLPCVIFYISSKKADARHPFSGATVEEVIKTTFKSDEKLFGGCFPVRSADIVHIGEILYSNGYEAVLLGCGADRAAAYKKQVDNPKYRERGHYTDDFKLYELQRDEKSDDIDGISATTARAAIKNGDFSAFYNIMGIKSRADAEKLFNELKTEMLQVTENYKATSLRDFAELFY